MIKPWMEGTIVVAFRSGVRVYDLGYCLAQCGFDKPEKCPNSTECRRFQVYVYRFNWNGTGEWRQSYASCTHEWAVAKATERALSEELRIAHDPMLLGYVRRANEEGRI